ncbi:MAG TPA: hypothetical protein VID27_07935 [Blastocatellia bacterium]
MPTRHDLKDLPDDFPDYLRHSDEDAPVPAWKQVTRSTEQMNIEMIASVCRIIADTVDEQSAREVWEAWPAEYRRSTALLIDKIFYEGWLDAVGAVVNVWDGGMVFHPRKSLASILDSKSSYTRSALRNGLFAYLNSWNHKAWTRSWMENDSAMAALHVGLFAGGTAEVHFDLFNPLYTNGAPSKDVFSLPFIGSFNHRLFRLHRRWEQSLYAQLTRCSAIFYHLMRDEVPLSF